MKGSQVAGLAVGWLAVALSMAAIGTASVGRVGVDTAGPRAQVTVTRTVVVGDSSSTSVVAGDIAMATSAPTPSAVPTATVAQYAKAVDRARTTAAPTTGRTSSAATQALPTSAAPVAPTRVGPDDGVARPGSTQATSAPTATPTKGGTKQVSPTKSGTVSTSTSVFGVSTSTWHAAQGAIRAGCTASVLTFVDPTAGKGFDAGARSTWLGTTITFSGATTLSVLVRCSDGKPSFTVLR